MTTHKKFYITFVYGINHDHQRQSMWKNLLAISQHMNDAWCIIRDSNVVLYKEDRRGKMRYRAKR